MQFKLFEEAGRQQSAAPALELCQQISLVSGKVRVWNWQREGDRCAWSAAACVCIHLTLFKRMWEVGLAGAGGWMKAKSIQSISLSRARLHFL